MGKLSLNVVSQLYEKFKALDGVGSLLAGGALAAGLYKIVSLSKKAAGSLAGLAGKGASGIGNQGTGLPGLPGLPGSIGSMTVNAANVVVNGKGVAGGGGLSDMPGTPDVPGTEGKGSKGGGKAPKGGKLGGFKNVAKGLLKGASKYAIPLEIASVGLDYYNANQENEQASWGAGYQLSEAKKQVAASTDALLEAKSRGASAEEINYLQKQHQDAVADMSQAQQYDD